MAVNKKDLEANLRESQRRKDLKGNVIDLRRQNPILRLNDEADYSHFFTEADQENVKALFNYFHNGFNVYISGEAAVSGMLRGDRQYGDIDMLVVSTKPIIFDMARLLDECSAKSPKDLTKSPKLKGNYIFEASGKLFQVVPSRSLLERKYMSGMVEERFQLVPVTPTSRYVDGKRTELSTVDLSLMTHELFTRNYAPIMGVLMVVH